MIKNTLFVLILTVITILGLLLRVYNIDINPPSLNGDEISFGYNAYSILKTGRDEYGNFMPIVFKSVGDYKNPVQVYLIAPVIKVFGLNEFSVRFPNAFLGVLSIPIFYFFVLNILKDKRLAIVAATFLSLSAWHIFYSRFAYESLMASLFILLGIWTYIKMFEENKWYWPVVSGFFFTLTIYTAFAARMFVPIFLIITTLVGLNKFGGLKNNIKKIFVFGIVCFILGLPMLYASIYSGAGTRFNMVFLLNDIEFRRNMLQSGISRAGEYFYLFFFWIKRYLSYLNPNILFFNSIDAVNSKPIGLGILYFFEIPFFIFGVIEFIRKRIPYKYIFLIWILSGLIPDSLTNNQQHAGRILHIFPVVLLISSLGAVKIYETFNSINSRAIKIILSSSFSFLVLLNLIHSFLVVTSAFPREKGESFDEGLKEVALFVNNHKDSYSEIIIDPVRGVDGPNMVSNPFLYILFYLEYDPQKYQNIQKSYSSNNEYYYKFDKYTFRKIDWPKDKYLKNTLFVGSPWSLSRRDFEENQLQKVIYLKNGSEAFYIVNSKD